MEKSPHSESAPETGMLKADPTLRRRLLVFLGMFALIGALFIVKLERHLEGIVSASGENPEQAARQVFQLLRVSAIVGGVGFLVFGIYFARFSLKVLSSGQFPPPGTRVVRDTRVFTGTAARARGGAGIAFAVLLFVLGVSVPWIPDLVIRPMLHEVTGSSGGAAATPPEVPPPAPDDPEQHASVYPFLPGCSETGPGPSAANRSWASS